MGKRYKIAAWALLGFVAAGVVVPALVLWILQPQRETVVNVTLAGTLPLDVFFLLDASQSISPQSWNLALDFASNMGLELKARLPRFRAGMGQFADRFAVIRDLSEDLSHWKSHHGLTRMMGHTKMAFGLCGNDINMPLSNCPGGAQVQLSSAPLAREDNGLDCGITRAIRKIIIVTDGVPAEPELTLAAARLVKDNGTEIMGILVQGTSPISDQPFNKAELYTLTSCCPTANMEIGDTGRWSGTPRPKCTEVSDEVCQHLVTSTDYEALVASVESLVQDLRRQMDCTQTVLTKKYEMDMGVLWFLLLLAPAATFLCWQNVLLCLSQSKYFVREVRASLALRRPELEMTSEVSSASLELDAATEAVAALAAATASAEAPAAAVPAVAEAAEGAGASGGASGGTSGGTEDLEGAARKSMPGFGREAGEGAGAGTGARGSLAMARGSQEGVPGGRRSRASETYEGGKKWAPVRTAYIVNGQRMNVDYGHSGAALPPTAQLGAHRGMDDWDTEQDNRVGPLRSLGHRMSRRFSRQPSMVSTLSIGRRFSNQVTKTFSLQVEGLPEEEVAPPLQKFNYSVLIPFIFTLMLLPVVVWKSGILRHLGIIQ